MRSQRGVNPSRRIFLHTGEQVRIEIKRNRNAGMPRSLACHLRVHSGGEKVAQVRMAQVVKPDGQFKLGYKQGKGLGERARANGRTVGAGTDQRVSVLPNAKD